MEKIRLLIGSLKFLSIVSFVSLLGLSLNADVVVRQDGTVIIGRVLQQDSNGILMQMDYGTLHYPQSWIKDVQRNTNDFVVEPNSTQRIPRWGKIISTLATNGWAHELKQIPATVIDNGVLEHVPYISFRCTSAGYEINIYGDLDNPAGVEIGAVNYLVKSAEAKSNCVNFIASILPGASDKEIVKSLNLSQKDLKKKSGLMFETTFPDESDSYGGWWVSVYDENALTNARASGPESGPELLAITQPRIAPKPQPIVATPQPTTSATEPVSAWSPDELSYSRPSVSSYSGTGGRVYVRGYYRKDGTYVRSYTRSSPISR